MSTQSTTPQLDAARVAQIAQDIRTACGDVISANITKRDATETLKDATSGEVSHRESVALTLARLSDAGNWSEQEIILAAAKVPTMVNDLASQKAITTYMSEVKVVMDPRVRSQAHMLVALRDTMWANETLMHQAADKSDKPATPLRTAFKRQYHMMLAMFKATRNGRRLASESDVEALARDVMEASRGNVAKAVKRLQAIASELLVFYGDFPVEDIKVCVDTLAEIDAKVLEGSAKRVEVKVDIATKSDPWRAKILEGNAPRDVVPENDGLAPVNVYDMLDEYA